MKEYKPIIIVKGDLDRKVASDFEDYIRKNFGGITITEVGGDYHDIQEGSLVIVEDPRTTVAEWVDRARNIGKNSGNDVFLLERRSSRSRSEFTDGLTGYIFQDELSDFVASTYKENPTSAKEVLSKYL